MKLWDGSCVVHEAFSLEKIINLIKKYPQAKFIAHPESESPVLEIANFIGSTSELLNFVQKDLSHTYIVATESGILYEMKKKCPNKMKTTKHVLRGGGGELLEIDALPWKCWRKYSFVAKQISNKSWNICKKVI